MTQNIFTDNNLISIIIPAYNSAEYIQKCLYSIYKQEYNNYEIIVAYDAKSTDNSLDILKNNEKNHNIIIDIGRDSSSGDARNRGLKLAKGEYIVFVDADDEILPDYLEQMYNLISQNQDVDVVNCGHLEVNDHNIQNKYNIAEKSDKGSKIINKHNALNLFAYGKLQGTPWAYMTRRKYLIDNNILFPNYSYGDDSVYVVKIIDKANKIGICSKKLYLFRQHQSSIINSLPENWYRLYTPSQNEIAIVLNNYNTNLSNIYNLRIAHWEIADSLKRYTKYEDFKSKITEILKSYHIRRLPPSIERYSIINRLKIICFNVSWRFYYNMHQIYYFIKDLAT